MTTEVISFTKVTLPYGWLGNMSPYPLQFGGVEWRTSEALFQALRFDDNDIKELIRAEKTPMGAKFVMKANVEHIKIETHSKKDIMNMKMCLKLKLNTYPELKELLIGTGDKKIIEDVTSRGDKGGNLFWGAMLIDDEWVGQNTLGNIWMELRNELNK